MSLRALRLVTLATLAASTACSAGVGSTSGGGASQQVTVTVAPEEATLAPGQQARFAAAVTGSAITDVEWRLDESGGGTVSAEGVYVAPAAGGTFHVRAVSRAVPTVSAAAVVRVTAPAQGAVAISPRTASVAAGGTVTFTARATNLPSADVTWRVQEASGCGSVAGGVYRAPASAATCHVVATSVSDPSRSDTATVTVTPVTVTVRPGSGTVDACRTLAFTATVAGAVDQGVTWSIAEGSVGGTITTAGVYTAPSSAGAFTVVASSRANPASTAQATVTVRDHVLSVVVDPASAVVAASGTQQFSATVTTTCGTFPATF